MHPAALLALTAASLALGFWFGRRKTASGRPSDAPRPEEIRKLGELLNILSSIHDKGASRAGVLSREDFGKVVLDGACKLMRCERGSVMLWDSSGGRLNIVSARPSTGRPQKLFLKPGEGVAGLAFSRSETVVVENPARDPRFLNADGLNEPFLSMPLLIQSKSIGVLNLHAARGHASFSGVNAQFLEILAAEAAVAFHNLDLLERVEAFYLDLVKTLARAVDSKDHYTHEHSDRASARARELSKALGLESDVARHVEYAALLHDIGKIGIDESILNKPGKLTAEEYEEMKKHPMIGHQILSPVKFFGPVAEMVLHHQEWYDGRGYPDGLKGEAIPLGARIVAVIDAWDAMTSDRPYRKALGRDRAIAELRRGAGTQFDPHVVEVFLKAETADADGRPRSPVEC